MKSAVSDQIPLIALFDKEGEGRFECVKHATHVANFSQALTPVYTSDGRIAFTNSEISEIERRSGCALENLKCKVGQRVPASRTLDVGEHHW